MQWTLDMAVQWGRESGARVNAIAPGPVLPPPNKAHAEKAGDCLTPRPSPVDVAAALKFLLETPSVTGQILYVAAGQQLLN
jgi:NAD(P)-dependent dehydrogenase (short-subunit alcohol dehydrogenase family)